MTRDQFFRDARELAKNRIHDDMNLGTRIYQLELAMTELLGVQVMKSVAGQIIT